MIKIVIVDDHPVVRAGLISMLRTYPHLEVVAGVSDGSQMFALLAKAAIDMILLDLRMPGMSGIDILKALRESRSPTRVIVLTSYESDDYIFEALSAGACAYLLKACSEEEMLGAIDAVHAGGRYLPQSVAARLAERLPRAQLSPSQRDVLEHLARGLTDRQTAVEMGISLEEVWAELSAIIDLMSKSAAERSEDSTGRRPTMSDIARRAGVSMATVSRVLHDKGMHTEETRRAVMKAVQECDFQRNGTAASLASMRNSSADD